MPNQDGGCKIAGINNLAGFISYDDPAKSMTYEKIGEKNYGDREKKEAMIQSHRDLLVWQRAIQLSTATYKVSAGFSKEELYGLTNQLRRASVSIASNIAEGYGRGSKGEYKQFLAIARGSNLELHYPGAPSDRSTSLGWKRSSLSQGSFNSPAPHPSRS